MSHVNPILPNDGESGWGDTLNAAIESLVNQGNAHDDVIGTLGSASAPPPATTTTQGVVQLAGDLTGSANAPSLKNVVTAGTVGSATTVPVVTFDAKGRVTAATTAPVATPTGAQLDSIVATLVNSAGTATRTAVQNVVGATGGGTATAPALVATAAPTILGTATVGQTLAASNGSWSATADSFTYAWKRGSSTISGATSANYLLVAADAGNAITVTVTAVKAGYVSGSSTSVATSLVATAPSGTITVTAAPAINGNAAVGSILTVSNGTWSVVPDSFTYVWKRGGSAISGATSQTYTLVPADAGNAITATVTATKAGYNTSTTTTSSNSILVPAATGANLIAVPAIQDASDASFFRGSDATLSVDATVAKSGGSSIKASPSGNGYPYVSLASPSNGAPVAAGGTYTAFVSVRTATATSTTFNLYLAWYDTAGNQISLSPTAASVPASQGNWVQVVSTGVAPTGAVYASPMLENATAGLPLTAVFNVDEWGVNQGTSTLWSATAGADPQTATSITDTGFTYNGTWNVVAAPSEHWSATVGSTATVSFTVGTGGGTLAILGKIDSSNGSFSVRIDNGTATTVSETGTSVDNAIVWTSATLAAGSHTATITVVTPEVSIEGAALSRGAFTTAGSGAGSSGGGTIGGGASATNPSGQLPLAANAFPGFTQTIVQDFATNCAVGSFANTYTGWAGYDGITSGASGTTWNSATTMSVTGSALRMRNWMSNGVAQAGALTPLIAGTGSWNVQAQTYGKYAVRFRSDSVVGFKVAWLLWPTGNDWTQGEIDFPEANLNGKIGWATHNVTGNPSDQLWGLTNASMADGNWHTTITTWEPGKITLELDGVVVQTITNATYVPTNPMRWDIQNEKSTDGTVPTAASDGSVYIDWIVQYKRG